MQTGRAVLLYAEGLPQNPNEARHALLQKYAERPPTPLVQYDLWAGAPGDDVVEPDTDGDWLAATSTVELMRLGPAVRVLIRPGTPVAAVRRLLGKLQVWLEEEPELLSEIGREATGLYAKAR